MSAPVLPNGAYRWSLGDYQRTEDGIPFAGPGDIEAGLEVCECGYAHDWGLAAGNAHRATDDHIDRLMARMVWSDFREEIDNGLGWARNEDMSLGLIAHDDLLCILDRLIANYVGVSEGVSLEPR